MLMIKNLSLRDKLTWAVLVLIMGLAVASGARHSSMRADCMKRGYPQIKDDGQGSYYCYRRVGGTDVIVPAK